MDDTSDFRKEVTYGYFNARRGLNYKLISPFPLFLAYENSVFRIGLKKKFSKTSELNFTENSNKEQLDNFNHLRFNSSLMNMQRCSQRTTKC